MTALPPVPDSDDGTEIGKAFDALSTAARAGGLSFLGESLRARQTGEVVGTFTKFTSPVTALRFDPRAPVLNSGEAVQAALAAVGITATVRLTGSVSPSLWVAFEQAGDAMTLARLIIDELPEPQAAAHRLNTAFEHAAISGSSVRHAYGAVEIKPLTVGDTLALCRALGSDNLAQGLDAGDWHDLEKLAELIGPVLTAAAGTPVQAESDPSCRNCGGEHHMEFTGIPVDAAYRIAELLEGGTHSVDSSSPDSAS